MNFKHDISMTISKEIPEKSILHSRKRMFDSGRCYTLHLPESLYQLEKMIKGLHDELKHWHCPLHKNKSVIHKNVMTETGETILSLDSIHYEIRISFLRNTASPDELHILLMMNTVTIWGYFCMIAMKNILPLRIHRIKKMIK